MLGVVELRVNGYGCGYRTIVLFVSIAVILILVLEGVYSVCLFELTVV